MRDRDLTDKDQFVLLLLLPFVAGIALPVVTASVDSAAVWLVEHQILVDRDVVLSLPGTAGVGLDLVRVILAAAVFVAAIAAGVITSTRRSGPM